MGRLRPKHPLLIQKHFLFILKTQVKIKSEVLVCGRARMWVGVRDHNLFIMDAQSPEVAAMGNHICFLPCLPCMEASDLKVHFFFRQFRHTFCPCQQHRHREGFRVSSMCIFRHWLFLIKYSILCIGRVKVIQNISCKGMNNSTIINPFPMNSQVWLRIHDNGPTLISGRPTENALQL